MQLLNVLYKFNIIRSLCKFCEKVVLFKEFFHKVAEIDNSTFWKIYQELVDNGDFASKNEKHRFYCLLMKVLLFINEIILFLQLEIGQGNMHHHNKDELTNRHSLLSVCATQTNCCYVSPEILKKRRIFLDVIICSSSNRS